MTTVTQAPIASATYWSLTTVVPTSLKRGTPKAPSRLSRWAVRRFVCGRATRMASLASRGGTNLPPEGWLCTVGVYCEVCGRYGSRWRCLALPAWRCLARSCRRQSSPGLAASPPHRHPKGGSYSIQHLCVRNLSTCPIPLCHAAPTPRRRGARQGPGRSLRSVTNVVLTSLKRGAPKAPSRLGRWAVRRFVCGRATRMASLASRSGTCLPPEGWLCTVGAYCEVCGRYGSRWRCLALPAWRYLARSCRRQSSPGLAASPPHHHPKGGSYSI